MFNEKLDEKTLRKIDTRFKKVLTNEKYALDDDLIRLGKYNKDYQIQEICLLYRSSVRSGFSFVTDELQKNSFIFKYQIDDLRTKVNNHQTEVFKELDKYVIKNLEFDKKAICSLLTKTFNELLYDDLVSSYKYQENIANIIKSICSHGSDISIKLYKKLPTIHFADNYKLQIVAE